MAATAMQALSIHVAYALLAVAGFLLAVLALGALLRTTASVARRSGAARVAMFCTLSTLVTFWAGGKGGGDRGAGGLPEQESAGLGCVNDGIKVPQFREGAASVRLPDACDVGETEGFGGMPVASNLMVTAVVRGTNATAAVVSWPFGQRPASGQIDIYAGTNLLNFAKLFSVDIAACLTNALVSVADVEIAGTNVCHSAFISVGDGADTDGDGLSDSDERFVYGTNPAARDTDGDGLDDGEEVTMGISPLVADTDCDGLDDGEETGTVLVAAAPLWVNADGFADLTGVLATDICHSARWDLPIPFSVQGVEVSNMTITANGAVFFNRSGYEDPGHFMPAFDFSYTVDAGALVVAPMSDECLLLKTNSSVSAGVSSFGGSDVLCVQYKDIGRSGPGAETNNVSFQVVVRLSDPDVVYVVYRDVVGDQMDGRNAGVGFQTFGGRTLKSLSYLEPGFVVNYRMLVLRLGTDTDPSSMDTDGDGLLDGQELAIYLNPLQPDSDGDGMNDGWEYRHMFAGFNPLVDNATDGNPDNDINSDPDGDGITNGQECSWGTNPSGLDEDEDGVADGYDTDGDGVGDGAEIGQSSDPGDASDGGEPNSRVSVPFTFGDPSESHSEKYRLEVLPVPGVGEMPSSFVWLNESYGQCETRTALLKAGWKYEVRLRHAGTSPNYADTPCPDYDYELTCDGGSLPSNVIVDDPQSLFGTNSTSIYFAGEGKVANVCVLAPPQITAPEVVGVNDDDDNGNGTSDWKDDGVIAGEDDIAVVVVAASCPAGFSGTVTVSLIASMVSTTLWKDAARTMQVDSSDTFSVPAGGSASRTYYLEGSAYSSTYLAERIHASLSCSGATASSEHLFTVVDRVAEPITTVREGGEIVNPCCAIVGAETRLKMSVLPTSFPDAKIKWRVVAGNGTFSDDIGRDAVFTATGAENSTSTVQIDVGDCPGRAPQFTLMATAMHEVKIYPCVVEVAGEAPPIDASQINGMINEVNVIYRQVGMHFSLGAPLKHVTNDIWACDGLVNRAVGAQIRNVMSGTDGIEVYFIRGSGLPGEANGKWTRQGIIVKATGNATTLAHEIGHACGLRDVYCAIGNEVIAVLYEGVKQSWMSQDWNNGTGCRFYDQMLAQHQAVKRLLMFGKGDDEKCDIPLGSVYGRDDEGDLGNVNVGRRPMMMTAPTSQ